MHNLREILFAALKSQHGKHILAAVLTCRRALASKDAKEILVHLEIGPDPVTGEPAPSYEPGDHVVWSNARNIIVGRFSEKKIHLNEGEKCSILVFHK